MNGDENLNLIPLSSALQELNIPLENRLFLAPIEGVIETLGCVVADNKIKYFRADNNPPLHISYGYTNGFQSEEEITNIFGDVDRNQSGRITGTWVVNHPVNKIRDSGSKKIKRQPGEKTCQNCGMVLSRTEVCEFC